MALTEIQWGRILALAWIDDQFKESFEKDPARALEDLKKHPDLGVGLFEELGLEDDSPLVDLECIVDYPVDFSGLSRERLAAIKNTGEPEMPDSYWYWGLGESAGPHLATRSGTNESLTKSQWTQIYARIWEDERFGNPKRYYKARFERNPAKIVKEITEEMGIKCDWDIMRLFSFADKPAIWDGEQLEGIVTTGKVNGHPLVWMVTKCCC
jgi:hypothetical protein